MRSPGYSADQPVIENGRTVVRIRAEIPEQLFQPHPIVRFTDRHDKLYYVYRHHTRRFNQNTDFIQAATEIDKWIRTGPKPDEPAT